MQVGFTSSQGSGCYLFCMRIELPIIALAGLVIAGVASAQVPAEDWLIGPHIKGRNYSVGMPYAMEESAVGPAFNFPSARTGHVHYVTLQTGPFDGARELFLRYRIDAARNTRFVAQEDGSAGTFGLAIHRAGDNWTARGRYEAYRWYSPTTLTLSPGVHTLKVSLDDPNWRGVLSSKSGTNPEGFASALVNAESVSMTFGGSSGRGHGVYATKPAKFTLLDFRIR